MLSKKIGFQAVLLSAGLGLLAACDNPQQIDTATQLVQAFGGSCTTSGSWTQMALSHSQAITTVIQNLANSDPCKPFEATLGVIQSASQQIQGIVQDSAYTSYRTSEESVQDLSVALQSAAPGSDEATALQQALVQAQVTLAQNQAANQVDQATQGQNRYATATSNLSNLAQQMLQQSGSLAQCLKSSPQVAVELASNLLAIGGSFISPVFGAAGSAIGQLVNLAVEYARQSGNVDALWKIAQVQMPNALGCGLETMSELYCGADDALSLLSLQSENGSEHPIPDFWKGTDLLIHRMPVLDSWLLTIRNGVLPGDPQEAARQDVIWAKLSMMDQTYRDVYGLLAQDQQLYNASAGNPTNQQNIIVKAILNSDAFMMGYQLSQSAPNPFTDQTTDPDVFSCWLVLGSGMLPPNPASPGPGMCPQHIPNVQDTGEAYIRNHLLAAATMQGIVDNWQGIYNTVKAAVDIAFAQTITANPESILAAGKEAPIGNISPYEALTRLSAFLQSQLAGDDGTNPNKPPFIRSILALVQTSIQTMDDSTAGTVDRVTRLFDKFQLSHGSQFIDTSVSQIVGWDLADRVRKHELPGDLGDILYTSGEDIAGRLSAAGIKDLDSIQLDLNKARSITTGNLSVFRELFGNSFSKAVDYLHKNAVANGEPAEGSDRPFGQTLGHLCTLILATGMEWPKGVSWDTCSHAVLNSIFPDPGNKITIHVGDLAQQLSGKPFEARVCAFHRFLRAGRYAEAVPGPPRDTFSLSPGALFDLISR